MTSCSVPRSVWITGARGFIGSALSRSYAAAGVIAYGVGHGAPSGALRSDPLGLHLQGDVTVQNLEALARRVGYPTEVVHLAGGSTVGASHAAPAEDFHRTVASAVQLLEWARQAPSRPRIVCVSSAAVYGIASPGPLPVDAPLGPMSPYGHHKLMMEQACRSFAQSFHVPIIIVRLFSVYGPGLRKQLVWDLCRRLATEPEELALAGSGEEVRDWLHIDDAVRLLGCAGAAASSECAVLQGCTGRGTSVRDIAETVLEAWGSRARLRFTGEVRPGDPPAIVGVPSIGRVWGGAEVELASGLAETVRWAKSMLSSST
ncbi:MAG: NAD-dependent epimerase/dehydratase family protein [Geminicoccaceae bacterium]